MDYQEFIKLLESDKYILVPELLGNFKNQVQDLLQRDVGRIMDILVNVSNIPVDSRTFDSFINKSSKIGEYFIFIFLLKLQYRLLGLIATLMLLCH